MKITHIFVAFSEKLNFTLTTNSFQKWVWTNFCGPCGIIFLSREEDVDDDPVGAPGAT